MGDKGDLSQNKENKIQFFWEWFNINKDKLGLIDYSNILSSG